MLNAQTPYYAANILIHTSVYLFFIIMPFKNCLRYTLKTIIAGAVVYGLITSGIILLFFEYDAPFAGTPFSQLVPALWILLSIASCVLLLKSNTMQIIFIILVTVNIQNSIIVMAKLLASFFQFPPLFGASHLPYLLVTIALLAAYCPIMWYLYIVLFKRVIDSGIQFTYWRLLTLIPLAFLLFHHISSFGGMDFSQPVTAKHLLIQIFLNMSGILTYVVSLKMLLKTYESLKAQEQVHVMEKQLEMQKEVYRKISENSEKTARLEHDFRHHLISINGFVQKKDMEALQAYLNDFLDEIQMQEITLCANNSIDIILRYYAGIAKYNNINFTVSAPIPDTNSVSDIDMCVVFGNLIENAMEACLRTQNEKEPKRFISVRAEKKGGQLFVCVENSFSGAVIEKDGRLLSAKQGHTAIGLDSVKKIAAENGGELYTRHEDGVFSSRVCMDW